MDAAPTGEVREAGLNTVAGFRMAGVSCDVRGKKDGRLDLSLVFSERACAGAGVFTLNDVKAAPVRLCQEFLDTHDAFHGFVVNSGNANACTGEDGMRDARAMAGAAARACGVAAGRLFVCSTGRIGERLPLARIERGIEEGARVLGADAAHAEAAARAILTSDTRPKQAACSVEIGGKAVTVAGIAKGAGMIQPDMATMLAFLVTDAAVSRKRLQTILRGAAAETFNRITIDGDMSTNDTVLLLANGVSGVNVDEAGAGGGALFARAVEAVCADLAEKIVGDGERVTKFVELVIEGAPDAGAAEAVARAVGNSLLVKTSWYGNDPNWGRLADAAGYARLWTAVRLARLKLDAGNGGRRIGNL